MEIVIIGSGAGLAGRLARRLEPATFIDTSLRIAPTAGTRPSVSARVEQALADTSDPLVVVAMDATDGPASMVGHLVTGPRWILLGSARLERHAPRAGVEIERAVEGEFLSRGGTALRLTTVFGDDDDNVTKVMRQLKVWRFPVVIGEPARRVHPVHIDDVTAFLTALAVEPGTPGRYALGGERSLPVRELLAEITDVLGVRTAPVTITEATSGLASRWTKLFGRGDPGSLWSVAEDESVDDSPARVELGWAPAPLRERLTQCAVDAGLLRVVEDHGQRVFG